MVSVSAEEAPILKPYMALGKLLGGFLGQVQADGATRIVIELDGKAATLSPEPVVAATSLVCWTVHGVSEYGECGGCGIIEWHCGINHSA